MIVPTFSHFQKSIPTKKKHGFSSKLVPSSIAEQLMKSSRTSQMLQTLYCTILNHTPTIGAVNTAMQQASMVDSQD